MNRYFPRKLVTIILNVSFLAGLPAFAATSADRSLQPAADPPPAPSRIVQFIRDRFEVPAFVRMTAEPPHKSAFDGLYESVVKSDDGKHQSNSNVFITRDGRCFVAGNVFALRLASSEEIIRCVREAAGIPAAANVTVGHFAKAPYDGFLKAQITSNGPQGTQSGEVFLTENRKTGVLGVVLPFSNRYVRSLISTRDQPSVGPENAPVTVVEYADLQCPGCAQFHQYLEKVLLPKYRSRIRLIFKEYPLPFHDWAATAATANECVYRISPSRFMQFRSLTYAHQGEINRGNILERLAVFAVDAGVDTVRLGACMNSQAAIARVKAGENEARNLQVNKTPTSFVNGRIVIGASPEKLVKAIDEALLRQPPSTSD